MAEYSFDVVSRVDLNEVRNALQQVERELATRFDFRNSVSSVELDGETLKLHADDEFKLTQLYEILIGKLARRGVSTRSLEPGKVQPAAKGAVRQDVPLKQGIDADTGRKIVKLIKDSGRKVSSSIQGDQVRVSGKNKDDLQAIIQLLRSADLPVDLQFLNFR